jgi:hypothetical protein
MTHQLTHTRSGQARPQPPGADTRGVPHARAEPTPTFAVQGLLEAPEHVRTHALGDRVPVQFGDDVHGVCFMATAAACGG